MSEKKKKNGLRALGKKRQLRFGWYAMLLTAVFIAVVVVLNVIVGAVEDKFALRIDVTANQLTSFSDRTYEVLDGLEQEVHVYLVFQKGTQSTLRMNLEEILSKYRARNGNIVVSSIDPLTEPHLISKYTDGSTTLNEGSIIVANADESRVKLIRASELYNYQQDQQTGQYSVTSFNGEARLTPALLYVTSTDTPKVYFLTGHGEYASSNCSVLKQNLQNENYDVSDLALGTGTELQPGDTVVLLAPQTDLTDDEYIEIRDWLNAGGRLLYANDFSIDMSKMPNFTGLLEYYSVGFETGMVVEDENATSGWISNPMYLIPTLDSEHDITKELASGLRMITPGAGSISSPTMPLSGYSYTNLLTSSATSYKKDVTSETSVLTREDGDESGPFTIAMGIIRQPDVDDPSKDTRIVLISNLYTMVDTNYLSSTANLDFTMNAFSWLVNREVSVYIRSKSLANTTLAIPDASTFWMLSVVVVVVMPLLVAIAGVIVCRRRRHL